MVIRNKTKHPEPEEIDRASDKCFVCPGYEELTLLLSLALGRSCCAPPGTTADGFLLGLTAACKLFLKKSEVLAYSGRERNPAFQSFVYPITYFALL